MSGIARTGATGSGAMSAELLAWSSSFQCDLHFAREDLIGSAAHVTMLARTAIIPVSDARALRDALATLHEEACAGSLRLDPNEEDIHMAVEAELARRVGPSVAARLHTARSRNDQVGVDLRLHAREQARTGLADLAKLLAELVERAARERDTLLPAYTHRQRAQPVTAAFLIASWCTNLVRAAEALVYTIDHIEMPLGSGACSGSSLPIDRALVGRLLRLPLSANALDATGDRGFALDFAWATARVLLALGKLAADVVDFATSEFALVRLDGEIAAGSSMMPQKKNPDIFELVRGKSARGIGNVVSLLTLVKGLASGYNRDQQEDRSPLLEAGPLLRGALRAVRVALPHVHFDAERGLAALAGGSTQATDLAEALVRRGVPFREAYKAVGSLVRVAVDSKTALRDVPVARARELHPEFDEGTLAALDPKTAVAAKESAGGTGPRSVDAQLAALRTHAVRLAEAANAQPSLDDLARDVFAEPLDAAERKA